MKQAIKMWTVIILVALGGFQVLSWLFNVSDNIQALWDFSAKYDILEEKYEESAENAFSLGRTWGAIAAEGYENEDFEIPGSNEMIAMELLNRREYDNYCWGPDDCGDMPTEEDLKEWFGVKFRSENMPVYSFRSGFINAFVEVIE